MQARYYDPVIGRFYSNDPVDAMGHIARGNPIHGFNRYTYANNNPYKYVDPDGEFGVLGALVGGAIGGIASAAMQYYQNDGNVNWGTVGAATVAGAAVGATGGLAGAAVTKIGLTGAEAVATVALPTSGVAAVGGAVTQMVSNIESGKPIPEGVPQAAAISATGTALGGAAGQKGTELLQASSSLGGQGALSTAGKVITEVGTSVLQETAAQGTAKLKDEVIE